MKTLAELILERFSRDPIDVSISKGKIQTKLGQIPIEPAWLEAQRTLLEESRQNYLAVVNTLQKFAD